MLRILDVLYRIKTGMKNKDNFFVALYDFRVQFLVVLKDIRTIEKGLCRK
jgi:hypothetical protein